MIRKVITDEKGTLLFSTIGFTEEEVWRKLILEDPKKLSPTHDQEYSDHVFKVVEKLHSYPNEEKINSNIAKTLSRYINLEYRTCSIEIEILEDESFPDDVVGETKGVYKGENLI